MRRLVASRAGVSFWSQVKAFACIRSLCRLTVGEIGRRRFQAPGELELLLLSLSFGLALDVPGAAASLIEKDRA
jgi:hypothetical protein